MNVTIIQPPKVIWHWIVFGDESGITFHLQHEVSWLARMTCRVLLRSKWERETPSER